jgi:D-sedoheptulose 7-phosphate isomerase
MNEELIRERFEISIETKQRILNNEEIIKSIDELANVIACSIKHGGKILICGNGGSASDSLHIAGEILGRFQKERKAYAAIALNSDVATMTAIANDYGYEEVFSRQVEGLMAPEDILLGISTSGNSKNIIRAFEKAHEIGGKTALLSGKDGGALKEMADYPIVVPSETTARIQETHMLIYHVLCEIVEDILFEKVE